MLNLQKVMQQLMPTRSSSTTAKRRSRRTVDRVKDLMKDGSALIDFDNPMVRERILESAIKRASKWMALRPEEATPFIGQVGGRGRNKKPILTLGGEYILKPLVPDHRGIREVAFYEAIETTVIRKGSSSGGSGSNKDASGNQSGSSNHAPRSSNQGPSGGNREGVSVNKQLNVHLYAAHILGNTEGSGSDVTVQVRNGTKTTSRVSKRKSALAKANEFIDTVALALAMMMGYRFVQNQQDELREAWKSIRREMEAIQKLTKFVPRYYGLVGQSGVSSEDPYGVCDDAYIMCQSVTGIFSQPCVIDLKMGTHTYEDSADDEKKARESSKYVEQETYGFRIVGMRFYDPQHPDADEKGFRNFDKDYGRNLVTRESVVEALRTFFSGGKDISFDDELDQEDMIVNSRTAAAAKDTNGSSNSSPTTKTKATGSSPVASAEPVDAQPSSADATNDTSTATNTTDTIPAAPPSRIRRKAISDIHLNLRSLRRWFEEQRSLQFVASSLLIIYEGDPTRGNGDVSTVKLIDFGHVRRSFQGDSGYTHGLRTLTTMLSEILETDKEQRRDEHQQLIISTTTSSASQPIPTPTTQTPTPTPQHSVS